MPRFDRREVASIGGEHFTGAESLRDRGDGRVDEAQGKIGVRTHQREGARHVFRFERLEKEFAVDDRRSPGARRPAQPNNR